MIREDFIIRLVKQIVQAIARMAGLRAAGGHEEARRAAAAAYDLLGVPSDLAAAVDALTLAGLLGHPEKIRLMVALSREEAELLAATGDPLGATARLRRALELTLEARRRDPQPGDADVLQELVRHVPTSSLDPRYRGPADAAAGDGEAGDGAPGDGEAGEDAPGDGGAGEGGAGDAGPDGERVG